MAREFLRADELLGTDRKELERLRRAMPKDGAKGYWRRKVENYRESAKSGYVSAGLAAMACVRMGDKQCAFEWLEKGFQERDDLMINLKVEPVFDGLREGIAAALEVSVSFLLQEEDEELDFPIAIRRQALRKFQRAAQLTESQMIRLTAMCVSDSAPKSIREWKKFAENVALYNLG